MSMSVYVVITLVHLRRFVRITMGTTAVNAQLDTAKKARDVWILTSVNTTKGGYAHMVLIASTPLGLFSVNAKKDSRRLITHALMLMNVKKLEDVDQSVTILWGAINVTVRKGIL